MAPKRIAIIGCGGRGAPLVARLLQMQPPVKLAAIVDPDEARVRTRLKDVDLTGVSFYPDHKPLLERADELDGVMICTRCHLHTPIAVDFAPTGLPLFLEKPVSISRDQLAALKAAYRGREDTVVVSFPLRLAPVFVKSMDIVKSGRLGTICQVQALTNVTYGGHYFGGHYRNYDESGGLWLQKATHDFDYFNVLMGCAPTRIAATSTRLIFGGDKPFDLRCTRCDETETCMESPANLELRGDGGGGMQWDAINPDVRFDHWCAFSKGIRNQDCGSAIVQYENGVHVSYSQNFVVRRAAGKRGSTVIGYKGTLSFDFDGNLRVVDHHRDCVEEMYISEDDSHAGGDPKLLRAFMDVIFGLAPSSAPLSSGTLSAEMSLAARESDETNRFVEISV